MNDKYEKYIEDLSPEMQEKARQCKTKEELNAFIAENDLELPDEALELVSGGGCGKSTPPAPDKCNKCNAKVTQCTDADLWDVSAYDFKRWHPQDKSGSGIFSKIKNINPFPQQVSIDISAHYRCPNCGIVYKDEIHA